jgi:hypothetical protein
MTLSALIDKAHEDLQGPPRPHLGVSMAGHHCRRWVWLSFRWAVVERFPGRILRLFRRGQREEETVVEDLRLAGVEVQDANPETGEQWRVDFGAHVSGSMDGLILSGVPEAPHKPHILEIKTHSDKSFKDLCQKGVEKSKPQHWAQMQAYMLGKDIDRALYVAVNKNDDSLYTERVRLKHAAAKKIVKTAKEIALSDRLPEPISSDPTWYQCKMCAANSFCHGSGTSKEINCRTCSHATAREDSTWYCERWQGVIPTGFQRQGCRSHVLHPDLVPWPMADGDGVNALWRMEDGKAVWNGEGGTDSREMVNAP